MLDELDTYSLADFLLFSQDTYYRLFELYNRDIWPLHVAAIALGVLLLWLVRRPDASSGRVAAAVLTIAWGWIALAFHLERYATINTAAPYFATLFGIEALLMLWFGVVSGEIRFAVGDAVAARVGFVILAFSIFLQPLIEIAAGREWHQVALFGLAPDPTAMATVGVLLTATGKIRWLMIALGLVWCLLTVITAIALGSYEAVGPGLVFAVAVVVAIRRRASRLGGRGAPHSTRGEPTAR